MANSDIGVNCIGLGNMIIGSALTGKGETIMLDKKNVINELANALKWCGEDDNPNGSIALKIWAVRDALALLKEQEPKLVKKDMYGNAYCPSCSTERTIEMETMKLHLGSKYCPYCGQEVQWNA